MMALLRRDRRGWSGRRHRLQRRAAQRTLFDQGDGEEGERKEGGCREENEAEENRKIGGGAEDPGAHGEGEPAFAGIDAAKHDSGEGSDDDRAADVARPRSGSRPWSSDTWCRDPRRRARAEPKYPRASARPARSQAR